MDPSSKNSEGQSEKWEVPICGAWGGYGGLSGAAVVSASGRIGLGSVLVGEGWRCRPGLRGDSSVTLQCFPSTQAVVEKDRVEQ